jgi:hypothetical protein
MYNLKCLEHSDFIVKYEEIKKELALYKAEYNKLQAVNILLI